MKDLGVALDVDGTIADTVDENILRIEEAWKAVFSEDYPLSSKTVKGFRDRVLRIEEYFLATFLMQEIGRIPDGFETDNVSHPKYQLALELKDTFYRERELLKSSKSGMNTWLSQIKLYPGVTEMLKEIKSMGIGMWIVSAKDKKSILDIWEYRQLPEADGVYDKECGHRPGQFQALTTGTGIPSQRMIVYDAAANLAIAETMGFQPVYRLARLCKA